MQEENNGVFIPTKEIYESINRLHDQVKTLNSNFQMFDKKAEHAKWLAEHANDRINTMEEEEKKRAQREEENRKDRQTKYLTTILGFGLPIIMALLMSGYSLTQ